MLRLSGHFCLGGDRKQLLVSVEDSNDFSLTSDQLFSVVLSYRKMKHSLWCLRVRKVPAAIAEHPLARMEKCTKKKAADLLKRFPRLAYDNTISECDPSLRLGVFCVKVSEIGMFVLRETSATDILSPLVIFSKLLRRDILALSATIKPLSVRYF